MIDKRLVAESFGSAAASYDRSARLQRLVGEQLMQRIGPDLDPPCILDLGCGTGYFTRLLQDRFDDARVYGLDLAWGMLEYAREQGSGRIQWLAGDAERMPLADGCVDLIFSSLALQWCPRIEEAFREMRRILRPGGLALFSTLVDGTLWELREAWSAVDRYRHVNEFLPFDSLHQAARQAGFESVQLEPEDLVLEYETLRQLTSELKGVGAHNLNQGRPTGMTGRQRVQALCHAYERFRTARGTLPATWRLVYGCLRA